LQRPCDILSSCDRLVDPRDSVRIALKLITPTGKCIDYLAPECLIQFVIADRLRTTHPFTGNAETAFRSLTVLINRERTDTAVVEL
jgi:hypothetical protein